MGEPRPSVEIRPLADGDWDAVRRIYGEGIETRNATFETDVPDSETLDGKWIQGQRRVAVIDGQIAGWAAMTATSPRDCYRGVVEASVYVSADQQVRGVGKALVGHQVREADTGGFWTLQTSIFPENEASLRIHESTGFRRVGTRERIAKLDNVWRDAIFLERRRADDC